MNVLPSIAIAIFALCAAVASSSGYAQDLPTTTAHQSQTGTPAPVDDGSAVVVSAKYVMKGETSNYIEFGPDGTFSMTYRGKVYVGTYKVEGDRVTYTAPWIPKGQGGARVAGDTIWDDDTSVWEREFILTNREVIKLIDVDLGDEIVIAKIKNAPKVKLDVSTAALLAMKKSKVSSSVIAAMIERAARPTVDDSTSAGSSANATVTAAPSAPVSPCSGVELMGLYKNEVFDREMGGGVVEWLAKIRNNTAVTKIVVFGWRDSEGQQRKAQVQIQGGGIASPRVDMTQARYIAPVANLRLLSCE